MFHWQVVRLHPSLWKAGKIQFGTAKQSTTLLPWSETYVKLPSKSLSTNPLTKHKSKHAHISSSPDPKSFNTLSCDFLALLYISEWSRKSSRLRRKIRSVTRLQVLGSTDKVTTANNITITYPSSSSTQQCITPFITQSDAFIRYPGDPEGWQYTDTYSMSRSPPTSCLDTFATMKFSYWTSIFLHKLLQVLAHK